MSKWKILGVLLSLVLFGAVSYYTFETMKAERAMEEDKSIKIFLAINSRRVNKDNEFIRNAYVSVLEEEGVPHQVIDIYRLMRLDPEKVLNSTPAIVFPDFLADTFFGDEVTWLRQYIRAGGNVAFVWDTATLNKKGNTTALAELTPLLGFDYSFRDISEAEKDLTGNGYWNYLTEENRDFWEIPLGKVVDKTYLSGYMFGKLQMPMRFLRGNWGGNSSGLDIFVNIETLDGKTVPGIIRRSIGKGNIIYVNAPLGKLKAEADDLPLRSFIRTFMYKFAHLPHVLNVPEGKGGISINWHVDSNGEHENFPKVMAQGLLHKELPMSFHITAGDFLDEPGDDNGFLVTDSPGKELALTMKEYGIVGSHGGWGHNWFAKNLEEGKFSREEIKKYIEMNNNAVGDVVGYSITEYSAPVGVHLQPVCTDILAELGVRVYYYTGDSGSVMNRTFYKGKMVSDKVLAFPIMPCGKYASMYEMKKNGMSGEEVLEWFKGIADFARETKTFRLIYSHPYDIEHYEKEVYAFLNWLEKEKVEGRVAVRTMTEVADFYQKFLHVRYKFTHKDKGIHVSLFNEGGLQDITFALPKNAVARPEDTEVFRVEEQENYYYVTVIRDEQAVEVDFAGL